MILKNFNKVLCLFILLSISSSLSGEEKIDIWKNKKKNNTNNQENPKSLDNSNTIDIKKVLNSNSDASIKIENSSIKDTNEIQVFGVYDPSEYNFNLNMWSSTSADDVRSSLNRLKKIKLSATSNEILENILLSFSYPPKGMKDVEFVNLKIDWLIEIIDLIFLKIF